MDGITAWESRWRQFERDPILDIPAAKALDVMDELVARLHDNYPFFHPDYAGQMLKPPHPIALAAYAVAARINPNNHALDGGPATAALEREAVDDIAKMFGYSRGYLGHLTSSGTIANLEALWAATRLAEKKAVAFSSEAHYTHSRMCELLGVPTVVVPVDAKGKLDVRALADIDDGQSVGTVVVTAGTTAAGAVDPIGAVVEVARRRGWRVHADAAYGGFFALVADAPDAHIDPAPWRALALCDSIVVDPHKHGLQPYGCGCVLFADGGVAELYRHDSPVTYFTGHAGSRDLGRAKARPLHLGEVSLECSRPGAAAAALWATLRCLPLSLDGLGRVLLKGRRAALQFHDRTLERGALTPVVVPELDIVAVACVAAGEKTTASIASARAEEIFEACASDPEVPLHLAKWRLPQGFGHLALSDSITWDQAECTVLRSVLMKPEHEAYARSIADQLVTHACWPV